MLSIRMLTLLLAGLLAAVLVMLRRLRAGNAMRLRQSAADLAASPPGEGEVFDPTAIAALPEPVQRYFNHALSSGVPLTTAVRIEMQGTIQLQPGGARLPIQATEILAPPRGLIWEAQAGAGLRWFKGSDQYAQGRGETTFRLWDLLPIVRADGPDVTRSARGRLAGESVWCPAALLPSQGARWEALDDRTLRVSITIDGESFPMTLVIDEQGRVCSTWLDRWGNQTKNGQFESIRFGMDVLAERDFAGLRLPAQIVAGWWYGTDHFFDFFHAEITAVETAVASADLANWTGAPES